MKRSIFYLVLLVMAILPSCRGNNNNTPLVPLEYHPANPDTKGDTYIGEWNMPITTKINNNVKLYYNPQEGEYYTKERQSDTNTTDSLIVLITEREEGTYYIEYTSTTQDNYLVSNAQSVLWRCPGYKDVACEGRLSLLKLAETYKDYCSAGTTTPTPEPAKELTDKEKASIYEWSKQYVRISVVEPNSLSFPGISSVKFSTKPEYYRIEYTASGKDLHNKNVVYPVNIQFIKDEQGNPTFLSIALE